MYAWYIPDGYVPSTPDPDAHTVIGHEAVAILNCTDQDAKLWVDVYFTDREPLPRLDYTVKARRSERLLCGKDYPADFGSRIPVPADTPYSLRITSDTALKLQFTRIDSRSPRMAIFSTTIGME